MFHPWVDKIPWRRERLHTPAFLPGEFHRQRSLLGYSPWGDKEQDMMSNWHLHFSLCSWFTSIYARVPKRVRLKMTPCKEVSVIKVIFALSDKSHINNWSCLTPLSFLRTCRQQRKLICKRGTWKDMRRDRVPLSIDLPVRVVIWLLSNTFIWYYWVEFSLK